MIRRIAFLAISLSLSGPFGHAYEPTPQVLSQSTRKIAVRLFENKTTTIGLKDRLTMTVNQAFNRDGRWQIVDESEADAVLMGEITRYFRMPLKHDAHNVTIEYKVLVMVDISFYDMHSKQTLWTERNLQATLTAPPASSGLPGGITEVEMQQKLWDQLAKDIATRTFEGFGTVTGTSDKAVSKSIPNSRVPPAPSSESFNGR
jgi:hypothetical protein